MSTDAISGTATTQDISPVELALATRNSGMPLELLASDITPLGLHYLLVHYDIPLVDEAGWSLRIAGNVERELTLDLDDLRRRPAVTVPVTMECAGNGRARLQPRPISQPWLQEAIGTAEWTGTPLAPLLSEAGIKDDTVDYVFTGLDEGVEGGARQRYERSLSRAQAVDGDVLLAYAVNGSPLPPQHGFPLRLVVPGWYGMASVKWLTRITAVTEPFTGYQQTHSYRVRQRSEEEGTPVERIAVRSLMVPPGIPEFLTRRRHVPREGCTVAGRAWSGEAAIERVELSDDGGVTWQDAEVGTAVGRYAWTAWRYHWQPRDPGETTLSCRATDAAGNTQPAEPAWNLGGYRNNAIQRVPVTVDE
jgi:DMSO/TMAO reductase YedYZ molybdopterin-dependent catalytic subunit